MIQAALQYFQPSNYISRYGAGLIQADKEIQHSNNIDAKLVDVGANHSIVWKDVRSTAGNKTMGAANKTSEAANSTMTNAAQGGSSGNQSASNSTNPLAKVPIIGKLFGGK